MSKNFSKKIVFVSGAGKGIGRSLVISLLRRGAYVYALSRTPKTIDDLKNPNVTPKAELGCSF